MANSVTFKRFGALMHGIAGLTLVLTLVGVIVRSTGSGLGCGTAGGWVDWPLCHGGLLPPAVVESMIEFSHRAFAALVTISLLGSVGWAATDPELRKRVGPGAFGAMALLFGQILLGALTVRLLKHNEINPVFVVAHLATAFTFVALLVILGLHAKRIARQDQPAAPFSSGQRAYVLLAAALVFGQAILGGLVANFGASMACPEFPTCAGGVVFPSFAGPMGLQLLHRIGAVTVAALIFGLPYVLGKHERAPRTLTRVAVGLVVVQFGLGVATVLLRLPLIVRATHHVTAYALFATLASLAYLVLQDEDRAGNALPAGKAPLATAG